MRKLQTNKVEVRELVIDNGESVTTRMRKLLRFYAIIFKSPSQLKNKLINMYMNNEVKPESLIVDFDESVVLRKLQQPKTGTSP